MRQKNEFYQRKTDPTQEEQKRCFNCGDLHNTHDCPNKERGPKCFICNQYGHKSNACFSKKPEEKGKINMIRTPIKRPTTQVRVNNQNIEAHIDSQSDFTVIREDIIKKKQIPVILKKCSDEVKGVGGLAPLTGEFSGKIDINNDSFNLNCYTMSEKDLDVEMIIGLDIINDCTLTITPESTKLERWQKPEQNQMTFSNINDEIQELSRINYISNDETHDADLSNIADKTIRNEIKELIKNYSPKSLIKCPIEMKIILTDDIPVTAKPRRLSPSERDDIERQVSEWKADNIIRESTSQYSANPLTVPKKDGTKRMCIDFRPINKKIIRDRFPIPNLEDQLDKLQQGLIYTTLDLKNGYLHVPIEEESRKFTSFVVPSGQYEFTKVPFGLSSSPSTFCRFINVIFKDLIAKGIVAIYMDDIIIIADNETQAIERLKMVLKQAESHNLNIKWKKCEFLKRSVEIFGYEIGNKQIRSSLNKTNDVNKYPEPKNTKQIQRFCGFANYFRKFIDNFAFIAKPLTDLLKKETTFHFGDKERRAFEEIKSKIISRPVLGLYDPTAETQLHTDASKFATASIIMQKSKEDNEFHPIHFSSTRNSENEEKWFSYELELYAIYLGVTKFRNYLIDIHFSIITDCEALKTVQQKKDVRKVASWLMTLQEFDFDVIHRAGTKMQHVDALSRIYQIKTPSILHEMKQAQETDDHIKAIKEIIQTKGNYQDYVLHRGLLCKFADSTYQIVVPENMQLNLIQKAHSNGHFKQRKLEDYISREFYIPKLNSKINLVVSNCIDCILGTKKEGKKEGLLNPIEKEPIPLDTFHMDHLGPLASTNRDYAHILSIIDSFTKFVWLYPVKSTQSMETLDKLKQLSITFGNPRRIITDKGAAFTSNIFREYCKEEAIELIECTTGIPRGNGQIERINRIIVSSLTKLSSENPEKWYVHVYDLQKFINATHQRAIKTTPFELMFGVQMKTKDNQIRQIIEEEMKDEFIFEREQLRSLAKFNKSRKPA